mgnify:CR=1 FL=1
MKKILHVLLFTIFFYGCDSERGNGSNGDHAGVPLKKTGSTNSNSTEPNVEPTSFRDIQGETSLATKDANVSSLGVSSKVVSPVTSKPEEPVDVPLDLSVKPNSEDKDESKEKRVAKPKATASEKTEPAKPAPSSPRPNFPQTVLVGNPGNAPDSSGYGGVPYVFRIGKFEVTNAEYSEFLNSAAKRDPYRLYDRRMSGDHGGIIRSGRSGEYSYETKDDDGGKPVSYVTWESCARYANWLSNSASHIRVASSKATVVHTTTPPGGGGSRSCWNSKGALSPH